MDIEPDLSICTLAGPNPQALRRLLRSIQDTADPVSFEVVIAEVNPGSATGLADDFPDLLVIHTLGLSRLAAINQAIRHCQARYTVLIDPDVVLLPECLARLVNFMDDTPDVGLAAPRIVNAYGTTEATCKRFPSVLALLLGSAAPNNTAVQATASEVDWCCGGFHLLRRECVSEIDLLDDSLPAYAELDLYRRARQQGWHNMYLAEAVAVHPNPDRYLNPLQPGLVERFLYLKKQWLP